MPLKNILILANTLVLTIASQTFVYGSASIAPQEMTAHQTTLGGQVAQAPELYQSASAKPRAWSVGAKIAMGATALAGIVACLWAVGGKNGRNQSSYNGGAVGALGSTNTPPHDVDHPTQTLVIEVNVPTHTPPGNPEDSTQTPATNENLTTYTQPSDVDHPTQTLVIEANIPTHTPPGNHEDSTQTPATNENLTPHTQPSAQIQIFEGLNAVPSNAWKYCPMTPGFRIKIGRRNLFRSHDLFITTCEYTPDYSWPQGLDQDDKLFAIAAVGMIGNMLGKVKKSTSKPLSSPRVLITDMMIGGKLGWKNPGDWTNPIALMLCRLNVLLAKRRFLPKAIMEAICDYGERGLGKPHADAQNAYDEKTFLGKDAFIRFKRSHPDSIETQFTQSGYVGWVCDPLDRSRFMSFYCVDNSCLATFVPYGILAARLNNWQDAYYHILHGIGMVDANPAAIQSGVVMGWVIRQMVRNHLKSKETVIEVLNAIHKDFLKTSGAKPAFQLTPGQVFLDDVTRAALDEGVETLLTRTLAEWRNMPISHGNVRNFSGVAGSLRTVFWAFFNSNSTEEGLLKIINLGQDSDTVATIAGQIFGAYYGFEGLPRPWLNLLAKNTTPPVGMDKPVFEMIKDFTTMDLKGFVDAHTYLETKPSYFPWRYLLHMHSKFKRNPRTPFSGVSQMVLDLAKE